MVEDHPSKSFDESSERPKKKKKKKLARKKKKKPLPEKKEAKRASLALGDPELDGFLQKIHEMDDEIQDKVNKICDLSGVSKKELTAYLENPENFDARQWNKMQYDKQVLEKKVYAVLGAGAKKRIAKRKRKKMTKGRKGKTLGARKKWLEM